MLDIQCSFADTQSCSFEESARQDGEDNVQWLERHYPQEQRDTILLLVGGIDNISLRVRMAQAKARLDYSPSHWSHIALMRTPAKSFGNTTLYEIRLDPLKGFAFPPTTNAVQEGKLKDYKDAHQFPNVALLQIPVRRRAVIEAVRRFHMLRNVINGVDLLTAWLAYVWGVSGATNPLQDEIGLPTSVFIEQVVAAAGFDLTPGLASRASCPEAVWQSAKWWHEFYASGEEGEQERNRGPIKGSWHTSNQLFDTPPHHES